MSREPRNQVTSDNWRERALLSALALRACCKGQNMSVLVFDEQLRVLFADGDRFNGNDLVRGRVVSELLPQSHWELCRLALDAALSGQSSRQTWPALDDGPALVAFIEPLRRSERVFAGVLCVREDDGADDQPAFDDARAGVGA